MGKEIYRTKLFNDPALVSYWRFEGNSNDSKGSNNGSDTSITYSSGNGNFGQGAGFNGSSSKIVITDNSSLHLLSAFTILGWIKASGTLNGNGIFQSFSQV